MLQGGIREIWLPLAREMTTRVQTLAVEYSNVPMLSRTHGQTASPTTVGKELAVFGARWNRQLKHIEAQEYLGKINGAVGNFNAHAAAYPDVDWENFARAFVESLGLTYNPLTTQIESHDYIAELFHALIRFNSVLARLRPRRVDIYFARLFSPETCGRRSWQFDDAAQSEPYRLRKLGSELGLSNAVFEHLATKLPVSRLQRDLTDSSALRNMGVGVAHSVDALKSTLRGLGKLSLDERVLERDLDNSWEVLGEAVQTVMRKAGHDNPYEKLKELTRGARITEETLRAFIADLGTAR
jgi:adenylosuccinate lyase